MEIVVGGIYHGKGEDMGPSGFDYHKCYKVTSITNDCIIIASLGPVFEYTMTRDRFNEIMTRLEGEG